MYRLDRIFFLVLSIDENIIQIHNDKDIQLFCKDFTNIALECCRSIGQSKKHHLILKVTVFDLESNFPLTFFTNSYPVISTGKVKLDKLLSLP